MYISNFFVQDLLYFNLYKQLEFQDLWNILHLFQAKFMKTKNVDQIFVGLSWSWLYGSWIYNYNVPVQSVPITTKVVSSNHVCGRVYSIEHYMIKFVNNLCGRSVFSLGTYSGFLHQ